MYYWSAMKENAEKMAKAHEVASEDAQHQQIVKDIEHCITPPTNIDVKLSREMLAYLHGILSFIGRFEIDLDGIDPQKIRGIIKKVSLIARKAEHQAEGKILERIG